LNLVNQAEDLNAGLDNYVNLPAAQQPTWPDQKALTEAKAELS
jgi:hypothetical protein